MQWESNIQMRNEFQDALLRSLLLERTCPYLVLRVRRENLIRETILQVTIF
jgi:ubiquitin-protein ligase E3 A